jgi:hypothetical protein
MQAFNSEGLAKGTQLAASSAACTAHHRPTQQSSAPNALLLQRYYHHLRCTCRLPPTNNTSTQCCKTHAGSTHTSRTLQTAPAPSLTNALLRKARRHHSSTDNAPSSPCGTPTHNKQTMQHCRAVHRAHEKWSYNASSALAAAFQSPNAAGTRTTPAPSPTSHVYAASQNSRKRTHSNTFPPINMGSTAAKLLRAK